MSNEQLEKTRQKLEAEINEFWAKGSSLDMSGYPEAQRREREYVDPFERNAPTKSKKQELEELAADPDVLAELARRSPKIAEEMAEKQREQVVLEFRRANRDYLPTANNYARIIRWLNKRHLDAPHLDDDDTTKELSKAGYYTLANLTEAYADLKRKGRLDVPAGQTRNLTNEEKLTVISSIRAGDPGTAVLDYLRYSFNGNAPDCEVAPREWVVKHPEITAQAVWFVFEQLHAGELTQAELRGFRKHMENYPIPTVASLESAYPNFVAAQKKRFKQAPPAPPEPVSADYDKLTNAEIDALIIAERRKLRGR